MVLIPLQKRLEGAVLLNQRLIDMVLYGVCQCVGEKEGSGASGGREDLEEGKTRGQGRSTYHDVVGRAPPIQIQA